ncbi:MULTISPECIES: hypothetical protein [unclassified Bradyrhizobium]|uniref:hypothetical protein n=1 Tax=unclassified Bradyrhizobium TaxID=2631580 RepID=UPI0024787A51|nr:MULTISPECIES: hypothetical protein [unclassified Bradyrhizobium]WGR75204.1 hypothetical protein MTX24_28750 [Bradyrhizobium sp. ISRA426]WGR82707.1 hypothetical protein MTX21_13860 [Bradyrhizobium sp. ISRA430]WGR90405.1 hypothetical protein MTX25_28425 [Bradyrhizobium sp. ISRA432]
MADVEASVRELLNRDRDCTERALEQIGLRRKINLLISEWKAAGGGDVLPDLANRMRHRPMKDGKAARAIARR